MPSCEIKMWKVCHFSSFLLILDCLAIAFGQMKSLGSTEYCAELKPQANLTISQLAGRWFGAEIITHRETVNGNHADGDCVQIVIAEINEEVIGCR